MHLFNDLLEIRRRKKGIEIFVIILFHLTNKWYDMLHIGPQDEFGIGNGLP